MKRNLPVVGILLVFALVLWWRGSPGGGVAEKPQMFAEGLTLASAKAKASEAQKMVLVMATADWCGPCQELKRGALRDPAVELWVQQFAVPAYLDTDKSTEVGALRVLGIPTLILFRGDQEVGRITGAVGVEELMAWLEESRKQVGGRG